VKSLVEEASLGIAQASLVDTDEKLEERVRFIHESIQTDAIAEKYIAGRELYVGVLGNQRLQVLPVWELLFTNIPPDVPAIATAKIKWDRAYQKKRGIESGEAKDLPGGVKEHIDRVSKRIYRTLCLSGYARLDYRLSPSGELYFLEANPNPQIAKGEDLADAAKAAGMSYEALLQKVISIGLKSNS
jgi:D-alanine-D-alanine ligase